MSLSQGRRPPPRAIAGQLAPIGALLALAAGAWVVSASRMAGMDAGPGTPPGPFGFYIATWSVMMAAMMLPPVTPVVSRYLDLRRGRRGYTRSAPAVDGGLFVLGYLAAWSSAGLAGYAVLGAGRSLGGGALGWDRAGRWIAAGVLLVAALYELTPAKSACLGRCRDARAVILAKCSDRRYGGLLTGMQHGAWCLGCCWALMAALFALGAMSVAWMVVISVLIACERLLPWRALGTIGVACALAALTIGLAAAPSSIPMLTIPSGRSAMRAMGMTPAHTLRRPAPTHMAPGMAPAAR
jgi:predicted metal-binding membrane protein